MLAQDHARNALAAHACIVVERQEEKEVGREWIVAEKEDEVSDAFKELAQSKLKSKHNTKNSGRDRYFDLEIERSRKIAI